VKAEDLVARQRQSQRAFYRALGAGSAGARVIQLEGVQATLVPVREWFSIFNSVFYESAGHLERAYPQLLAAYEAAGVMAWTVWVPPGDGRAPAVLEHRGHVVDSTPMLYAASIRSLDLDPRMALDLEPDASWKLVAEVNDRAHGVLEPWSMTAVVEAMDDPASHLYVARHGGVPASALVAREHEGDCYLWFVATVPEARCRGIAGELMRHALREARGRGHDTTTLESTKMAEAMYSRLGYQQLGRYTMWERQSVQAPA
jgi:ribosomal protein S18 acetylase RimI-like enzyme